MRHLYVHVPFCARRCVYCDFSIAVRREVPTGDFLRAVLEERELRRRLGRWDESVLRTLYLGGGTPSKLGGEGLAKLVRGLVEGESGVEHNNEITIEVNPDDVTPNSARRLVKAGVNRVSVGIQTYSDSILTWMHRTHDGNQGRVAISILRDAGIENISIDLLFGLPPSLEHDFATDLETTIGLEPDHLSVYGLTSEERSAYGRWISRDVFSPVSEANYSTEFLYAHELLEKAGYEHYEISNYARPGKRSVHNQAYWDGSHYGGLGPSAHGYDGRSRRWNIRAWSKYLESISAKEDPIEDSETLHEAERQLERVYLALRTSEGFRYDEMAGFDGLVIAKAEDSGWAYRKENRWRLSALGWLRIDELVGSLTTLAGGG